MKKIGLTTTVPIEVLIAAGYTPIDLNNIFVTSDNSKGYLEYAHTIGFPKNMCAWIKGIYGACIKEGITEIIGVMEGDCSNTKVLIEILRTEGITVHPFSFPHSHELSDLTLELEKFMVHFNVTNEGVESVRQKLNVIRLLGQQLDSLTYIDCKATGFENHLFQLCLSDFDGDVDGYRLILQDKIQEIQNRIPQPPHLRIGYIGVPPMTGDLFDYIESKDGRILYNEVQREFAFPRAEKANSMAEQYHDYTYPYDFDFRLKEIQMQIKNRNLHALIHYSQAFCHKSAETILLKKAISIPILVIEGDQDTQLDARTKLRIEAFMDMLNDQQRVNL